MQSDKLTIDHISIPQSFPEKSAKSKPATMMTRGGKLRTALGSLLIAAGGASVGAGFWMLDIRAKNLGYINVFIAGAVIAGAALIALGVAAIFRAVRVKKENAVK